MTRQCDSCVKERCTLGYEHMHTRHQFRLVEVPLQERVLQPKGEHGSYDLLDVSTTDTSQLRSSFTVCISPNLMKIWMENGINSHFTDGRGNQGPMSCE